MILHMCLPQIKIRVFSQMLLVPTPIIPLFPGKDNDTNVEACHSQLWESGAVYRQSTVAGTVYTEKWIQVFET